MPVHDWSRVEPGIFHDFHTAWIAALRSSLNEGLLPSGYYALAEQHAGQHIPDLLTLHASPAALEPLPPLPQDAGGTAVAEAPPRVRRRQVIDPAGLRRTLAIRHVSGHRLIALVEILSPANKDRAKRVEEFVNKVLAALSCGIHVLVIDLFPPGPHDPRGIHGALLDDAERAADPYDLPTDAPLTLAGYSAGPPIEAYLEHPAFGDPLPPMPLFLSSERYIDVPLEETYQIAYRGMPAFWREVLEQAAS